MKIRPSGLLGLGRPVPSHAACLAEKVNFILFLLFPLCSYSSSSSTTILTSGVRSRSLACSRGSQHSLPLADCLGSPVPDQSEACHVDCSQPSCVLSSWSSWSEVLSYISQSPLKLTILINCIFNCGPNQFQDFIEIFAQVILPRSLWAEAIKTQGRNR